MESKKASGVQGVSARKENGTNKCHTFPGDDVGANDGAEITYSTKTPIPLRSFDLRLIAARHHHARHSQGRRASHIPDFHSYSGLRSD